MLKQIKYLKDVVNGLEGRKNKGERGLDARIKHTRSQLAKLEIKYERSQKKEKKISVAQLLSRFTRRRRCCGR